MHRERARTSIATFEYFASDFPFDNVVVLAAQVTGTPLLLSTSFALLFDDERAHTHTHTNSDTCIKSLTKF